jgi:hypothetical protein
MSAEATAARRPWWWSREWWLVASVLVGMFVAGFGYIAWFALDARPGSAPPTLAFVLVPFAALGPEIPTLAEFLGLASLNTILWSAVMYAVIAVVIRWRCRGRPP